MARNSPKKTTATPTIKKQIAGKPRNPPCCTKCPGRPHRSQCTHTTKGRQFILEQNARAQFSAPPVVTTPLTSAQGQSGHFRLTIKLPPVGVLPSASPSQRYLQQQLEREATPSQLHHASVSDPPSVANFVIDPFLLMDSAAAPPSLLSPPLPTVLEVIPSTSPDVFNATAGTTPPSALTSASHSSGLSNSTLFTPQTSTSATSLSGIYSLNAVRTPSRTLNAGAISPIETASQNNALLTGEMADRDSPAMSRLSISNDSPLIVRKNKKRATASKPIYGHVTGVLRGTSSAHEIHRTHHVPLPIEKSSAASKAFLESINSIFIKCEDVSLKTGCWLFLGTQHANALGGALHYASPRLRKDGRQEANDYASQFLQLVKNVSDSRKVDVLELQGQLRKSQQEAADTGAKLQAALKDLEALKATNDQQIQEYRASLGLVEK